MALQKSNSDKIKMYKKIIGATGIVAGLGITAYTLATGDNQFSHYEAVAAVLPIFVGGIIGTWGDKDSTSTKGDNTLERKVSTD